MVTFKSLFKDLVHNRVLLYIFAVDFKLTHENTYLNFYIRLYSITITHCKRYMEFHSALI
jgi:hypothetical protein